MWLARLIFLAVICIAASARAQAPLAPLYDTPVYFAPAKKYFELINIRWTQMNWAHANQDAQKRVFKGTHGRLAIADSLEVHEFLLKTFHIEYPALIGLRYWCDRHKLEWSDGTLLEPGSFQAWDSAWMQEVSQCSGAAMPGEREQYMAIAYSQIQNPPSQPFRWYAKGWYKAFWSYFVEYPTGGP